VQRRDGHGKFERPFHIAASHSRCPIADRTSTWQPQVPIPGAHRAATQVGPHRPTLPLVPPVPVRPPEPDPPEAVAPPELLVCFRGVTAPVMVATMLCSFDELRELERERR